MTELMNLNEDEVYCKPRRAQHAVNAFFHEMSRGAQQLFLEQEFAYVYRVPQGGGEPGLDGPANMANAPLHAHLDFQPPVGRAKRRKVNPACLGFLQDPSLRACRPVAVDSSRLSRDMARRGGNVYSVDFGYSNNVPTSLHRWGSDDRQPKTLLFLTKRENGITYFSDRPLEESDSARVLAGCDGMDNEKMLSRMLLFLSPSVTRELPHDAVITCDEQDDLNDLGIDASDGMSRCSIELAAWVLECDPDDLSETYAAFQFRGVLPLADSDQSVVCKGMCRIDTALQGKHIALANSCSKGKHPGARLFVQYGIDVTRTSAKKLSIPRLSSDVLSSLSMRASIPHDPDLRDHARGKLEDIVETCRAYSRREQLDRAFGLPGAVPPPVGASLSDEDRRLDEPRNYRTPVGAIDVVLQEELDREPTPMHVLEEGLLEIAPHRARLGTREAFMRGCNQFWDDHKINLESPSLAVNAFGATVFALSDKRIPVDKAVVTVDNKVLVGKFAMFRHPCHAPWDFEVHEAVLPPPDFGPIPNNCIVLSGLGKVNSGMAGGDLDGDLNMLWFHAGLVDFLEATERDTGLVDQSSIVEGVKAMMPRHAKTPFEHTGLHIFSEFMKFAAGACTADVRGRATNLADCAINKVLQSSDPWADGTMSAALNLTALAHLSFDVPKHYTHKQVFETMRKLRLEAGLGADKQKATDSLQVKLQFCDAALRKRRMHEMIAARLDLKMVRRPAHSRRQLGMVWVPTEIALGEEAGRRVGEIILEMQRGDNCGNRRRKQ